MAGSTAHRVFGYSITALGDRDGDGLPELGLLSMSRSGLAQFWVMSYAEVLRPR